jgi:hypothetical protein
MTERQNEIHKGLNSIGPEIAQFYLDGLELINSNLGTKSYLLAHILREIDGGLRNIFEQKQLKEKFQKEIKQEDLEKLFDKFKEDYKNYDYLSDITFQDFKKEKGHISSIMVSFGFNFDHPLSAQYIKIARWLSKYAHRSGAFNEPRDPSDIINLWNKFEDVLSKLIGNYYALADRIDSILQMDEPSEEVLKTLPNLLNTESRFIYFFNGLKSTKWLIHLENEGYFDGSLNPEPIESEDNPGFYSMPYWGVLQYLEEVSKQNLETPEKGISETLVRIIDGISLFKKEDGERIDNYRTDYTLFKLICKIPEEYICDGYFSFIKESLQSKWNGLIGHSFTDLLERLIQLKSKKLLLKSIELLLTHKYIEEQPFDKVHSIFRSYELTRILTDYKPELIAIAGLELLHIGIEKAKEVIKLDKSTFNNISIPAIENHKQTSFPDKYDCQLVYLIRDCLEKLPAQDIIEILKGLLASEHPIFMRIAVHIIRVRYKEFKDLYWDWDNNPLNFTLVKHEIYELHKEHSVSFTDEEIKLVLKWIEEKEYYIPEEFKDEKEKVNKSIAYRKKEWLTSIIPSGYDDVTKLIKELNSINDAVVEHPGFDFWHSSLTGNISPLTIDEILKLTIEETIAYYEEFNKQTHDFMGPSVDGLIDVLTFAIRKNPKKYNNNCNPIINAPSQIRYSWMRGFNESWRDEKLNFECYEIFQIVIEIIKHEEFWVAHNSNDNYNQWFISSLLSFIEDGLKDDRHAFEPEDLPAIKEILFIVFDQDKHEVFDYSDLSMTVVNNSKGKIYMAFFQYSLRLARLERIDTDRWDNDVKTLISGNIESNNENPLLFYVLGQFLPNIHYLDESWMIKYFNKLFPIESEINWSAALSGYFFFNRRPNKLHFKLLLENGHFEKAILNDAISGESKNSLIEQICTAYLYEFDKVDLKSKIVQTLIGSKNESVYSSLIYFFWSPRFPFESRVIDKIKPLWIDIFNESIKLKNVEIDNYILSGCCKWVNSISEIDEEIFDVLLKSIGFVNQQDRYSVIESLSKHINNYPERVGLILIELFKKEVSYDISRGKLQEMVEILFEKGQIEIGNNICLLHAEQGFHFLRELYIKYNT